MKITEILKKQRKIYVDFFKDQSGKCKGSSELLLESKTEEEEEYYRLYRFDCVEKEGEEFKIIEFNNDSYINHEPINYTFNEMKIELHPFFWNGCELNIFQKVNNWKPIISWIKKWIEDDDENSKDGELSYKIHNFQRPVIEGNKSNLAIDFGTAEIDSLIELIKVLEKIGVKKIKIHSTEMIVDK